MVHKKWFSSLFYEPVQEPFFSLFLKFFTVKKQINTKDVFFLKKNIESAAITHSKHASIYFSEPYAALANEIFVHSVDGHRLQLK